MSYTIIYTESYIARAKRFFKRHSDLIRAYEKTLLLLEKNPLHPSLRLHRLEGKLKHLHSVSINMKYRVTLELIIQEEEIILIDIGSHDQVYH